MRKRYDQFGMQIENLPKNKLEIFRVYNDTNKWVLIVDGYFKLFDTKKELDDMYNMIFAESSYIDDTAFECVTRMEPGQMDKTWQDESAQWWTTRVSQKREIDLYGYITKSMGRRVKNYDLKSFNEWDNTTAIQRLNKAKQDNIFDVWAYNPQEKEGKYNIKPRSVVENAMRKNNKHY